LGLTQSSRDQRANVHARGIRECNDNHFAGDLIEREAPRVLIDQSKIFNRSPRNAPLGRPDPAAIPLARANTTANRKIKSEKDID